MMKLACDLHIHSCLSPCADEDMTPANICGMAHLKGLDAIAVTDHNSARNLPYVKEAADYYIKMADKAKESQSVKESNKGIEELRKRYWLELLEQFATVSKQFQNVNPSTDHWLSGGSGVSGIPFTFVVTKKYASVEISINHGDKEVNEKIFDLLYAKKDEIEKTFGAPLLWERLDEKKSCRIGSHLEEVNIANPDDWQKIKDFQCDAMPRLDKALRSLVQKVAKEV